MASEKTTAPAAPPAPPPPFRGRNKKTILFFALAESGQINPQLAAAQGLLTRYPDFEVHFASFTKMRSKIERISDGCRAANPAVKEIVFHEITGPDRMNGMDTAFLAHRPGRRGLQRLSELIGMWPFDGEVHFSIYQQSIEIIRAAQPAVVVIDFAFRPPIDAVHELNWNHIIISALALADIFGPAQPWYAGFWKYPALGTGFSFPVPWYNVLENIWVSLKILQALATRSPDVPAYLTERGINPATPPLLPGVPFICQTLPEASIPVPVVPPNVVCAGAILLDSPPASDQDHELVGWVRSAPTIVVNLGSLFKYTAERAEAMGQAIKAILEQTSAQVLWKLSGDPGGAYHLPLMTYIQGGRLRMYEWVPVDMLPLLRLETVIAAVHHGGSSSFNEAMSAGVPQVILPIWQDLYNFAQLAEDLGLGVYATRGTAPEWTVDGIVQPIMRVIGQTDEAVKIRAEAKRIGAISASRPGQAVAADEIAKVVMEQPEQPEAAATLETPAAW